MLRHAAPVLGGWGLGSVLCFDWSVEVEVKLKGRVRILDVAFPCPFFSLLFFHLQALRSNHVARTC
jgi:hypothetical protein